MINEKFKSQVIGIIIGLAFFMLGLLTPLSTIITSGIGLGIICFNILISSFENINYKTTIFILPLLLLIIGSMLIFVGILTPISPIIYCSVGMIIDVFAVVTLIKINRK